METITVTAARTGGPLSLSEMELLVGSALVIGMLVWMVLTRMRRDHKDPHV